MKRSIGLLLVVFGLLLALDAFHAEAQAPPPAPPAPIYVGSASKALFDCSGLDAKGNQETLKDCEFGLASPLVLDLNQQPTPAPATSATAPIVAGPNAIALGPALQTYSEGQYRFWIRLRDARGNATPWFGGILVAIDNTPPAPPTNFRISIDGTASLKVEGDKVTGTIAGTITKKPAETD